MSSWTRILSVAIVVSNVSAGVATAAPTPQPIRESAARVTFQAPKPAADSNANGAGIGALVGGGALFGFYLFASASCGSGCENDVPSWTPFAAIGLGVGGGAVVGYLIDKAHNSKKQVAVMPAVSKRGGGVKFAVRF